MVLIEVRLGGGVKPAVVDLGEGGRVRGESAVQQRHEPLREHVWAKEERLRGARAVIVQYVKPVPESDWRRPESASTNWSRSRSPYLLPLNASLAEQLRAA
jgi:hypothetical protein